MSITFAKLPALSQLTPAWNDSAQGVIVCSSFLFAVLQSICTFFAAVDGLRLFIGVGSLAVSAGIGMAMDRFHQDWIRVPMLALLGSSLNLVILMQLRYLRNRPASRWRQRPLSPNRIRMQRIQMVLSLATLVLIGAEEYLHFRWCGHL